MVWVIIVIIILVLLMILVLKNTKKYHITWYWCQNIMGKNGGKKGQKIWAGVSPPPLFGQCPKENIFFFRRASLRQRSVFHRSDCSFTFHLQHEKQMHFQAESTEVHFLKIHWVAQCKLHCSRCIACKAQWAHSFDSVGAFVIARRQKRQIILWQQLWRRWL